jgi:hypothetical protein
VRSSSIFKFKYSTAQAQDSAGTNLTLAQNIEANFFKGTNFETTFSNLRLFEIFTG